MGLKYELNKNQNHLGMDFKDAYWVITDITYSMTQVGGWLRCYPNRESYKMSKAKLSEWESIPFGGPTYNHIETELWQWEFIYDTKDVFPNGVPLSTDEQKTAIYNYLKADKHIAFEDVFEDCQSILNQKIGN